MIELAHSGNEKGDSPSQGSGTLISPDTLSENAEWLKAIEKMSDRMVKASDINRGLRQLKSTRNLPLDQTQLTNQYYDGLLKGSYATVFSELNRTRKNVLFHDSLINKPIARNSELVSPLLIAIQDGRLSIAKLLTFHGVPVNQIDSSGCTPLMNALQDEKISIAEFFVYNDGCDYNIKNVDGNNALHFLAKMHKTPEVEDMIKEVVSEGLSLDSVNVNGETPLHMAVIKHNPEMVSYLVAHGADPSIRNKGGYTPRGLASAMDLKSITMILPEDGGYVHDSSRNLIVDKPTRAGVGRRRFLLRHKSFTDGITIDSAASQAGRVMVLNTSSPKLE